MGGVTLHGVTCNPFRPLLSVLLVEPVVSSGNTAFGLRR